MDTIINELKQYLEKEEKKVDDYIIDAHIADKIFTNLDFKVKEYLNQLFGDEKDTTKFGKFNNILTYSDYNIFSDGVIYSFWTYRGESDIYNKEINGDWRKNFFYKGIRWSNKFSKEKFYHFFKFFEDVTNGNTTIEFFVELGLLNNKKEITIKVGNEIGIDKENNIITLPTEKKLNELKIYRLTILLNLIKKYKRIITQDEIVFKQSIEKEENKYENFKKIYDDALNDTKQNHILSDISQNIKSLFENNALKNIENYDFNEIIFGVIITLLYFDIPYDIHIFLPNNNDDLNTRASLIITTAKDKTIDINTRNKLKQLIDILKDQSHIEKKTIEKWKNILPTYLRFREKYKKISGKYERISNIGLNLIQAIAFKNNINFKYEINRVKDFDSFFNKIIKIANDSDDTRADFIRTILKNVKTDKLGEVCSKLNDIAGARIICLFQDETEIILNELNKLNNNEEIIIVEEKNYEQSQTDRISEFGYRSYHRVFKLGSKRHSLYEFEDLKEIKCELQIRTLLADTWANASHQLFYKKNLPEGHHKLDEIKANFHALSANLKTNDQDLVNIKENINNILSD